MRLDEAATLVGAHYIDISPAGPVGDNPSMPAVEGFPVMVKIRTTKLSTG
jgi:hypothetical protein